MIRKLLIIIFFIINFSNSVYANANIVELAVSKKLHKNIHWIKLLHYDFRNERYISRALDPDFFYAPDGKTNPESELLSTIKKFISSTQTGDESPACKFPARYNWLHKELGTGFPDFDFSTCTKLNHFKEKMKPKSISIVFVSAMMRVPASMFGHTFIKFNKEDGNLLTDYTFSYVAKVDSKWVGETIVRGLSGGFFGFIEYLDFEYRMKYYNVFENRSMWEFNLNFNPEEIQILLNHLWELESTRFKYYFASENCSYYNSFLLEVARPSIKLVDKFDFVTIPADTMKRIIKDETILIGARYYPANILQYQAGYNKLNFIERDLVNSSLKEKVDINKFAESRKDLVLNTLSYGALIDAYDEDKFLKPKNKQILEQTFKLMNDNQIKHMSFVEPDFTNPSIGHLPSMIGLNYGSRSDSSYLELVIRPLMHDYNDSPLGYLLYSEINILQGKLLYNFLENAVQIKQVDFLRLLSISPNEGGVFNLSWNVSLAYGLLDPFSPGVKQKNAYGGMIKNGYGAAWKIPGIKNEMAFYIFLNGLVDISKEFDQYYRAGLSGEAGIFWYPFDIFTTNLIMEYGLYYPYTNEPFWKINGNANLLISRNISFQTGFSYDIYNQIFSYNAGVKLYY